MQDEDKKDPSNENPITEASDSGQQTLADKAVKHVGIPEQAEDNDLIEKEWVDKAKQIVEHTRENPYEQQKALNAMKSEYMKKRYNKDLKTDED